MSLFSEEPDIDAAAVARFHKKADTDGSDRSLHHTLGNKDGQAAKGNHIHDGKNGLPVLSGFTITGAKGGNTALASVINALKLLGATDTTTP